MALGTLKMAQKWRIVIIAGDHHTCNFKYKQRIHVMQKHAVDLLGRGKLLLRLTGYERSLELVVLKFEGVEVTEVTVRVWDAASEHVLVQPDLLDAVR